MNYVLGVDGGNTKTDLLLFTRDGRFVDVLRRGTCSHEAQGLGFDGAFARLKEFILELLGRNNVELGQLSSAAFGLAGVDLPFQHAALTERIETLGIPRIAVSNDSILGIKAASSTGAGVCSVNGTGTVTCGIDPDGAMMQVGGIGAVSSDAAGAHHIALKAVSRVHDQFYRCEKVTSLQERLMKLLGVTTREEYLAAIHDGSVTHKYVTEINILLQQCANEGDEAAMDILDTVGDYLGRSTAGCVRLLNFPGLVEVILIGSVWVKCIYPGMRAAYEKAVHELIPNELSIKVLSSPPATGAVVWALMLADETLNYDRTKQKVLSQLTNEAYEKLVRK